MILYANADRTAIVGEHDPDARWVVNTEHPEGFEDLLAAHNAVLAAKAQAAALKAQRPAEDKAARPAGRK